MTELLTAAQMRAIEQAAIASGEVTGLELMERAGRGVVEAILKWRPELAMTAHRAVVLCGPGNNGGDGFVVARLLKQRGWEVEVFLYGDEAKLPPDAAKNCRRWREMGTIGAWNDGAIEDLLDSKSHDLVVDGLWGTGLTRAMPENTERVWHGFMPSVFTDPPPRYVAIDIPSGICSDSGANLEGALPANLTVTFHRPKIGHFLAQSRKLQGGPSWCTKLVVVDIGLDGRDRAASRRALIEFHDLLPDGRGLGSYVTKKTAPPKFLIDPENQAFIGYSEHKYQSGHALILAGGPGKGGAARLAARGALRIGAGLVTVGCPPAALQENAARLDAVMLASVKGVDDLLPELRERKIRAVCLGPGFGTGERLRSFVAEVLRSRVEPGTARHDPLAVVLDADALTEYRNDPETLFAMLQENCVLTPHAGEFGRLFPDLLMKLKEPAKKGPAYSKVDATREAASRAGCVVLFKGADTVVAAPDGRCSINSAHYERAAPGLATAGSGDVLAGFITGLLARGLDPMTAAETAAWLHVECARKFGPGLIAEDLPEQLPAVFRDLGL